MAAALKVVVLNLKASDLHPPPGFHRCSQMLFFVAPCYRRLQTRLAGVWVCTQASAALSHPIYGLNLLVLRYHFEVGFISQESPS